MDRDARKALIWSLAGSVIFFVFFQPILGYLGTAALRVTSHFANVVTDWIYFRASDWPRHDAAFHILSYVMLAPVVMIVYFVMKWGELETTFRNIATNAVAAPMSEDALNSLKRRSRVLSVVAITINVAWLVIAAVSAASELVESKLNISFQKRVAILAPHIEGLEEKRLRAQWASMTKRQDYDAINAVMEKAAASKGVSLPKPFGS